MSRHVCAGVYMYIYVGLNISMWVRMNIHSMYVFLCMDIKRMVELGKVWEAMKFYSDRHLA